MEKLIVCILNKNDGKNLNLNKDKIKNLNKKFEIILVDSNSKDISKDVAKEINLKIFDVNNLSRGEAIKECVMKFKKSYDYIIFTSSDGEEDFDDLCNFKPLFDKGADMVIASRLAKGGYFKSDINLLWIHRKIYLILITFLINKIFKGNVSDCWNGYRGFRLKCFEKIDILEKDYLVEAETTIKFLKNNFLICEFPTKENPRKFGKSGNKIIKSGIGHLTLILKNIFN